MERRLDQLLFVSSSLDRPLSPRSSSGRNKRQFLASLAELAILIVMKSTVVASSPDVMGGTPVFAGTEGGEDFSDRVLSYGGA